VDFDRVFVLEISVTQGAVELPEPRVDKVVFLQFGRGIEALGTFAADVWLDTAVSKYMFLVSLDITELHVTDGTRVLIAFVVRLQQMCLELVDALETVRAMSTRVHPGSGVSTEMLSQTDGVFKPLPTVGTFVQSSGGVGESLVLSHVPELTKGLVTLRAAVLFVTGDVYLHVTGQTSGRTKDPVTHTTPVRLVSCVNPCVSTQSSAMTEPLAASLTLVRFDAGVDCHVSVHVTRQTKGLVTHVTFVPFLHRLSTVNLHVFDKVV